LAFDGARSLVAEQLGLPFEGELARAGTVYVTFEADLSKYVEHRPSILHWIFNANAGFGEIGMGLLRAVEPWRRWIAGWGFDMTKGVPDLGDERVTRQIRDLVGDPDLKVNLIRKSTWYVNQQFATRYHSGRVLCGGDAVHRHPPSNGLGANTSLQDAFNLAWKVAYVVKGYAGAKLLESYSEERVPVGRQIVERANQSRADFAKVRTWFDHEAADPVAGGMTRLREPSPDGVKLRDELFAALEQKHYEFNAHGVELNQRYASGAVLADPLAEQEIWTRDRELYAQATTRPGAKLPHVWLVDAHGRRVSTLDLVGRGSFTVLTGLAGRAWEEAAHKLGAPFLRTVVIGEVGAIDVYGRWRRTCEMHEAGALLVRPDGYVAWREVSPEWDVTSASEKLSAALTTVLGLSDHVGGGHD
jgi:2,4-dichlorophenol 6-monooxygenase